MMILSMRIAESTSIWFSFRGLPAVCLAGPPRVSPGSHDSGASDHDGGRRRRRGHREWSGPMLADIVDRVLRGGSSGNAPTGASGSGIGCGSLDRTEEFPIWLFGIVDVALWDLEGRVLGVPVHLAARDVQGHHSGVCIDDDLRRDGGVPRRRRSMPRAGLPGHRSSTHGAMLVPTRSCASACVRMSAPVSTSHVTRWSGRVRFAPDAVYLGHALWGGFRWYEEPMREDLTAYKWLAERVQVRCLLGRPPTEATSIRRTSYCVRMRVLRSGRARTIAAG